MEELWEDKYVAKKHTYYIGEGQRIIDFIDYEDKYGAVLYRTNSDGQIDHYYLDEADYLTCIRGLE